MKQFLKRMLVSNFLLVSFGSYAHALPGFSYHHPDENGAPCDDRHPMGWCQRVVHSKEYVYKVLREEEWVSFQNQGVFAGSEHDLRDGFIHLAYGHQLNHVISGYFSTESVVYISAFKRSGFGLNLIEEQMYPHLYNAVLSNELLLTGTLRYVMPRKL
jgi:uncharacterized protein (DUF952 family)